MSESDTCLFGRAGGDCNYTKAYMKYKCEDLKKTGRCPKRNKVPLCNCYACQLRRGFRDDILEVLGI